MTQPLIATLIAVGAVAILLLAIVALTRTKRITLVDYPELPAPKEEAAAGGASGRS